MQFGGKPRLATNIQEPRKPIVPGRETVHKQHARARHFAAHGGAAALGLTSLAELSSSSPEDRKFGEKDFDSLPLSGPLCFNHARAPGPRRRKFSPDTPQGWVEEEMRMSLVHEQLPGFVAGHPDNRDLPSVRTDSTCVGVRTGVSRK